MLKSKFFNENEIKCQHCGELVWEESFFEWLDQVRFVYDKPMVVSSGYRCPEHPIEARKHKPGAHTTGCAVDIAVYGPDALRLISIAYSLGCRRIGVNQKGKHKSRFIHLDQAKDFPDAMWSY